MKKIIATRKRKLYRSILKVFLFFIGITLFFHLVGVQAGSRDSKLEKNRMEGVYAVAKYNGEEHLFYLNMYTLNGIVSYCIEMGKDITTEWYNSTEDFSLAYLPKETKEYIQSIAYFGYQYPGHDQYFYYMAAQELIWEYLSGGSIEWTSEFDKNGARIDIESYKREILSLRERYYAHLDLLFSNLGNYALNDHFKMYVRGGDLSFYEVSDSGHSTVTIENDYVDVKIGTDYVGREHIAIRKKEIYANKSRFYYYDNSQQLISAGNFLEDTREFEFNIQGKGASFLVIDGETKENVPYGQATFEGATYQLYTEDNQFIEEFSVNENGKGYVDNLPYGNYIVRQIKESRGYLLNEEEVYFSLGDSDDPVLLEEYLYYQEVRIYKKYDFENTGKLIWEDNIQFEILDFKGEKYTEVVTNKDGYATFRVPYGFYTIHQINTLFGYKKVEDVGFGIYQYLDRYTVINLVDDYILCKIKLVLVDQENNKKISSDSFSYKIFDVNKKEYLKKDDQEIFHTDSNGELLFPLELGYGDYLVEEVAVASGYLPLHQKISITLNENSVMQMVDGNLIYTENVNQQLIKGTVTILTKKEVPIFKKDKYIYSKKVRSHVEVDLISQEDIVLYGETLYSAGEVIKTISTGTRGEEKISLLLGKYCVRDKEISEEKCFSLEDKSNGKEEITWQIEFLKKVPRMSILYHNQDNNGDNIKGTIAEVKNEDNDVVYRGITNDDGNFLISDLPSGKYCFFQKKIAQKYLIRSEEQCVEISEQKDLWNVLSVNQISSHIISVPDTFEEKDHILKLISIILFLMLGGIFYQKVYRRSH